MLLTFQNRENNYVRDTLAFCCVLHLICIIYF